jgi:hypothetical protein
MKLVQMVYLCRNIHSFNLFPFTLPMLQPNSLMVFIRSFQQKIWKLAQRPSRGKLSCHFPPWQIWKWKYRTSRYRLKLWRTNRSSRSFFAWIGIDARPSKDWPDRGCRLLQWYWSVLYCKQLNGQSVNGTSRARAHRVKPTTYTPMWCASVTAVVWCRTCSY